MSLESDSVATQIRYCSVCGAERTGESCPRCVSFTEAELTTGNTVNQVALRKRRGAAVKGWPVLGGAVSLALVAGALTLSAQAMGDAARTATRLRAEEQRTVGLRRQFSSLATSEALLSSQLADLEAKVTGRPNPAAVAKKSSPSVFTVVTPTGIGLGFVVSAAQTSSELVTNFHVISDTYVNGGRTVRVKRNQLTYTGRITRVAEADDLAVITVPVKLAALPIATTKPAIGDPLLVLGSPLGLGGTVTSGIVSAYRNDQGTRYLQFSAPISPGNSGGPVLNDRGEVVGVSVAKYVGGGAEGLSLAVPADRICPAIHVCPLSTGQAKPAARRGES
jgi:S1-C subfamily serine protease